MENDRLGGGGTLDQFAAMQGGLNQLQFYPNQQPCPHCGYCPHCGRGGHNTLPHYPQPYPWPMNPAPWSPPFTVFCGQANISGAWFNK